ncbi:oligosaccharide flippase family protein [Salipiger mucosus]|uniref:Polysaccharide biosynthesis protein n=1 Tax=Salipiger mucosus DSM 16094 TaxID=1123237 RepID=S9SHF8_9RHOB|nr:oligosaccharide flippase family protein [Salipiger mucosus]EPX85739.1 polysaccharide biosynthesis protein [Salipiger mucosus DSM 16094]
MVRRSFFFSFADKSTGLVLTLATMAVVSRLMTPAEVGLFMVASSLVILIEAFRDFGVAAFLIQEPELTPDLTRSAVTVIGLMSLGLGLCMALSAGLAAALFEMPELGELIRIAALGFLAAPISNPLVALMQRDMNFAAVARINISAAAVNAATTITLAILGFGAFSFVWGSVCAAATSALGAAISRPEWWIFRPTLRHWRRVVPFGAWTTVVTLLGMLFEAMPRLILGKAMGFGAVGLFTRSVSLTQMPDRLLLSAVQPVVLPALSAQVRAKKGLVEPYLLGISLITAIQWPALLCLALLADPIVRLLLGPQWLGVIPLVQVVSFAAMLLAPIYLAFPVLVATGRVRQMALLSLVALPLSMAVILVATRFGLSAVAWSLFPANAIHVGLILVYIRRLVGFRWTQLGAAALRSAVVALCTGATAGLLVAIHGVELSLLQAGLAAAGAFAGWLGGLALTGHPLAAEISHLASARLRMQARKVDGRVGVR